MKALAVLLYWGPESSLCPASAHCVRYCPVVTVAAISASGFQVHSHSVAVLVFKQSLFYLIMAPTCKSGSAGNWDVTKRSGEVLSLCER